MKCKKNPNLVQNTRFLLYNTDFSKSFCIHPVSLHNPFHPIAIQTPICKPFAENIAISTSTSFYHHFVLAFLQLYHCNHFMSYLCGQFSPPIFYILYLIEVFLVLCHSKNVTATYSFKHKYTRQFHVAT